MTGKEFMNAVVNGKTDIVPSLFNPDIRLAEVYAPHDSHTEDDWCGATLELG